MFMGGEMRNSFERRILSGVARYARRRQPRWHLRWGFVREAVVDKRLDGLIVFAVNPDQWQQLRQLNIPMVVTSSRHVGQGVPAVVTNDLAIGALAAKFLKDKFFRSFAYFGPLTIPFGPARGAGFAEALKHDHLYWIHAREFDDPVDRLADIRQQLLQLPPATAVFCGNDVFARALFDALEGTGRKVPHDLAVLGVDADELVSLSCPIDLSSVDPKPEEIGLRAAELLDQLLLGDEAVPSSTVIQISPGEVIEGTSTEVLATEDALVRQAHHLIRQHACNQDFSLDKLATMVGCSRRLLEIRFARLTAGGIATQMWKCRLDKARELLMTTNMTLAEVAEQSGFRNPYHFSEKFRKVVGLTPGHYRRTHGA